MCEREKDGERERRGKKRGCECMCVRARKDEGGIMKMVIDFGWRAERGWA